MQKVEIKLIDCKVANAQKKQNSGQVNGKEQRFHSELEGEWYEQKHSKITNNWV